MWILAAIILGVVVLAHTAPVPFVLDALAGSRAVWHMPRGDPPTVYLTFDDGPLPSRSPVCRRVRRRAIVRCHRLHICPLSSSAFRERVRHRRRNAVQIQLLPEMSD